MSDSQQITIEVTLSANADLHKLKDYLSTQFDERTAARVIKKIFHTIQTLKIFPARGKPATILLNELEGYFFIPEKLSIIFYKYEEQNKRIIIIRVLSTREEYALKFLNFITTKKPVQ